jgi:hypothetical protein
MAPDGCRHDRYRSGRLKESIMMHTSTDVAPLDNVTYAKRRDRMAADELSLALHAAGASMEDVERCLAAEMLRSSLTKRVSQRRLRARHA